MRVEDDADHSAMASPSLIRDPPTYRGRPCPAGYVGHFGRAHFGLSRASLYRLFAPVGGIADYIRSRRLHRAFFDLANSDARSPENQRGRAALAARHRRALLRALQGRLWHHAARGARGRIAWRAARHRWSKQHATISRWMPRDLAPGHGGLNTPSPKSAVAPATASEGDRPAHRAACAPCRPRSGWS